MGKYFTDSTNKLPLHALHWFKLTYLLDVQPYRFMVQYYSEVCDCESCDKHIMIASKY